MGAKREQLLAWLGFRQGPAGVDIGVRMRSMVFALLGLTTASCLAVVAILVHQGVPSLPALPLPGIAGEDEQRVSAAEAVEGPRHPVAATVDRLGGVVRATDGAGPGRSDTQRTVEAPEANPPGPSSVVAPAPATVPATPPTPASETPASGAAGSPAPVAAPTPSPVPVSAPVGSSSGPAADSQPAKTKPGKATAKHGGSSGSKKGAEQAAAAPSTPGPVAEPSPEDDAAPDPAADAGTDSGKGHGHGRWK